MTELDIRRESADVVAAPQHPAPLAPTQFQSQMQLWAQDARTAAAIAQSLANTSFVPKEYRGKPAEIAAAILAGMELGLKPMATLKSVYVIQGVPTLSANAMRGLVQSHGHKVEFPVMTPVRCVARGLRAGETQWQQVEWTIERAALLGVVSRNPEWKKQPQTMLVARATAEVCRLIAADVLSAMPYAAEEMDSPSDLAMAQVAHQPVTVEEVQRRTVVAAAIEQAPQDEPAEADPEFDWDDQAAVDRRLAAES